VLILRSHEGDEKRFICTAQHTNQDLTLHFLPKIIICFGDRKKDTNTNDSLLSKSDIMLS